MPSRAAVAVLLAAASLPAQHKPTAAVVTPWMDLAPGTDVTYAVTDENTSTDGVGSGGGGAGRSDLRVVVLGHEGGRLRLAIFDQQLPKQSFETALVRAEIAMLDVATGALERDPGAKAPLPLPWSPMAAFPFPPLSPAEWKGKKPVSRAAWTPVAGEGKELPFVFTFGTRREGKKQVPTLTVVLDSKVPVAVELVGIAGIVAIAEGRMPKLGVSGVEPVPAQVQALRRVYDFEVGKARVLAIETTGTVVAGGGKLVITCRNRVREQARRTIAGAALPEAVAVVEELCAVVGDVGDRAARRQRAEALRGRAAKAGFGELADRLVDSLTRDGLPPGFPR
jgi:hypothetical protein